VRRRQGLLVALAALAGAAQCGTTGAPPPAHAFPVQEFTLPSGLKLVIEQDDVSPIAGIVVTVDVGAVDDPAGKTGMAHVLEHLVFRVPDETGVSVFRRLHKLGAASFNAHTAIEETTYHAFGPRQTLDALAATLLGRLADPLRGARDVHVSKEVSITAEEQRRREGASGYAYLVPALMPAGDPVGRAWAEIRRADTVSLADVQAFADRYYRPERMTVVISGPVPAGWDEAFIASLPAALRGAESARRAPVRRPVAAFGEPPPRGATADGPLPPHVGTVNVPELWIGWRVPPSVGISGDKLAVIAHVIRAVLSSRLDLDGTNDVLDVDGVHLTGNLFSVVGCRFRLRAASDAPRINKEATAALEALADPTLVYLKGRLRWSNRTALQVATLRTALGMEGIQGRAMVRAELVHSGSSALISNALAALEALTSDDLTAFAARYLKPDAARSVLVVPEEMPAGRAAAPLADTRGSQPDSDDDLEPYGEDEVEPPDDAKLAEITQAPGARAALVRTLPNGLTIIALRRPGLPFASMLLGFHADPQPGDAPGARIAFSRVLRSDLSSMPVELGLLRSNEYHADKTFESVSMFSADVNKALDFLAEEADTLHVYWPHPAFERYVHTGGVWEATPDGRAAHAFRTALFGSHPYHLVPGTPAVRKVTEREVQAWFDRVHRPANAALVVVGEIDPEAVVRDAGKALSGWKGDRAPPPPPPAPPAAGTRSQPAFVHTQDARRRSADVRFGCFLPPVRDRRGRVVNALLSDMFQAGLWSRLRWDMGVTYAPDVDSDSVRGGTAWFSGRVDVDAQALPKAVELLHVWLDAGRPSPIDARSFEQTRWDEARRSGLMNVTGEEMARSLFSAWNMGWQPAVLDDYPRDLASVTLTDLESALEVCRRSAVISVLGPEAP
jgi:zinc protease